MQKCVIDRSRYFDVLVEYAKASPEDILIRITVHNRGDQDAPLHVLPTVWFRNTWSWGGASALDSKPELSLDSLGAVVCLHPELGKMRFYARPSPVEPQMLFTENVTNAERCFGLSGPSEPSKDAFHEAVVHGRRGALSPEPRGTKAAAFTG